MRIPKVPKKIKVLSVDLLAQQNPCDHDGPWHFEGAWGMCWDCGKLAHIPYLNSRGELKVKYTRD